MPALWAPRTSFSILSPTCRISLGSSPSLLAAVKIFGCLAFRIQPHLRILLRQNSRRRLLSASVLEEHDPGHDQCCRSILSSHCARGVVGILREPLRSALPVL